MIPSQIHVESNHELPVIPAITFVRSRRERCRRRRSGCESVAMGWGTKRTRMTPGFASWNGHARSTLPNRARQWESQL